MRNIFLTLLILFTNSLMAQTHQIIKHDGGIIDINFIKTEASLVHYTLAKSTEEKTISQFAVAQLKERSQSYTQMITEKIQLKGKLDYTKIIILKKNQTNGLKESGIITSFYGGTKGETPLSFSENGEKRLKQKAALKGHPFIVILSNTPKNLKAITFTY
ncbi:hypothetical protein [Flavobacterium sp. LB2R40]|uniref:hypothetical protein n=1 Tax=unclassified Flavobacterium TaxID=196869 RepID=UPI003AAC3A6D